mmetsp:Transcript_14596/g.29570  ORF Transcript_14596/g.29570 Transcript_14596/m.29570 type:complete len:237 (+) Transcript_14596:38-748(+)
MSVDALRFRPADTGTLPPIEDEQCYRMGEVLVTSTSEGLGLMLTGDSNMVADIHSDGPGARGGVMVGDIILAVDDRVVTSVDWRPAAEEGVVVCRAPYALEPAGLALDRTKPTVSLKVLRPVEPQPAEEIAPPSLAEEMAAARARVPQAPSPSRAPAPQTSVAEQPPPSAQERERMTAQVHAMYPWATQIETADGVKNKYNLAQGTTLQPLQPLQPLDLDATMRKTAAFAAPLGRH